MQSVNDTNAQRSPGRHRVAGPTEGRAIDGVWFAVAPIGRRDGRPAPASGFVGRVGALAVALGVGIALVTTPAVAIAETGDNEPGNGETDNETDPTDTPSELSPTNNDDEERDPDENVGDEDSPELPIGDADENDEDAGTDLADAGLDTGDDPTVAVDPNTLSATDIEDPAPAHPPVVASDPDAIAASSPVETTTRDEAAAAATDAPALSDEPLAADSTALVVPTAAVDRSAAESTFEAPQLRTLGTHSPLSEHVEYSAVESTVAQQNSPLAAPAMSIGTVLSALLAPLLMPSGPATPVQTPILWAVLAWVRRQFEHTFANKSPVIINNRDTELIDPDTATGTVTAVDPDPEDRVVLVYSGGDPGARITLDPNGAWTYTAPDEWDGTTTHTDTFTITATEQRGGLLGLLSPRGRTVTTTVAVTITPSLVVNQSPVAVNDTDSTTEDTPATGNVLDNDADSDTPLTELSVAPGILTTDEGGTITFTPNGDYTYTPAPNFAGDDTVEYTMTDGTTSATATLTIAVMPVDDAPVAVDDVDSTLEDTPATGNVLDNDTDIDTPTIELSVTTGTVTTTEGGTITFTPDGTYSYTPPADFSGTDTVEYTMTDGATSDAARLTITVAAQNDAPTDGISHIDDVDTDTGIVTGHVAAADVDGDTLTYSLGAPIDPAVGAVVVESDTGAFTFVPTDAARLNTAIAPDITFSIVVSDGEDSVTIGVTAPITAHDRPPTPDNPPYTTELDTDTGVVTGSVHVTDPEDQSLSYRIGTGVPTWMGTVTIDSNGAFVFTPSPSLRHTAWSTAGDDYVTFTVIADDGHGTTAINVEAPVAPANEAPVAQDQGFVIEDRNPVTGAITGRLTVTDPDGDRLRYTLNTELHPAIGTLTVNPSAGTFTFTPTAQAREAAVYGSDSITFSVIATDSDASTSVDVQAPILVPNRPPTVADPSFTTVSDPFTGSIIGRPHVTDPDFNDVLTYSVTDAPDPTVGTVTIDPNTGTFVFTPTSDARQNAWETVDIDSVQFTVTATDGAQQTADVVVTVILAPAQSVSVTPLGNELLGVPGTYDQSTLHGSVVARNGTVYQSASTTDPASGIVLTTVAVIRPDGTTTYVYAPGQPAGAVVLSADGTAYQTIEYDYLGADTPRTGVIVITPAGESSFVGLYPGKPSTTIVIGIDGTSYQTVTNSITRKSGIVVISPDGDATFTGMLDGMPLGEVVIGPDGSAYQVLYKNQVTTVVSVRRDGTVTSYTDNGSSFGSDDSVRLVRGHDGTLYHTTYSGQTATVSMFGPNGRTQHTLAGSPMGPLVISADGTAYQMVYRNQSITVAAVGTAGVTELVSISGLSGVSPLAADTDGGVQFVYAPPIDPENPTPSRLVSVSPDGVVTTSSTGLSTTTHSGGSVSIGPDGARYVTSTSYDPDRPATIVLAEVDGELVRSDIPGYATAPLLTGPNNTAYLTTSTGNALSDGVTTISVITPTGTTSHQIAHRTGDSTTALTSPIVIGPDDTAYVTARTHHEATDTYTTTVARVTVDGITPIGAALDGFPAGPVSFGPDGTIYQSVGYPEGSGFATTVHVIGELSDFNEAPEVGETPFAITDVDAHSGTVTGHVFATDADADRLTYVITNPVDPAVATVTIDPRTGQFSFAPTAAAREQAWQTTQEDTATFTVTATDGQEVVEINVVATILPANHVPEVGDPAYTQETDTETGVVTGTIAASDRDPADTVTYTLADGPATAIGTVTVDEATGAYTFTPTQAARETAWATAEDDTVTFTVTVEDTHAATTTITVTAHIAPAQPAQQEFGATASVTSVNSGTGLVTGAIDVTGTDSENLTYTVTSGPDPEKGILVVDEVTGLWAFKPTAQARVSAWNAPTDAVVTFTVTVDDGTASATTTVTAPIQAAIATDYRDIDSVGDQPFGLAFDDDGRMYVANTSAGTVTVVNPNGSTDAVIDVTPGDEPFVSVFGVAAGTDGRVYVSTQIGQSGAETRAVVVAIDPENDYATSVFAELDEASGLAFDSDGRLYTGSWTAGKVTVLNADGTVAATHLIHSAQGGPEPGLIGVAVGQDGRIYIAGQRGSVTILHPDGTVDESVSVGTPLGVAVLPNGRIVVTSYNDDTLTILNPDGSVVDTLWAGTSPAGITVHDGRIYVSDLANGVVEITPIALSERPFGYSVADGTGVVAGSVDAVDPADRLTYTVTTVDPALGSVSIDPATGLWTFTPSAQARFDAWRSPGADTAEFTITGTFGDRTQTFDIVVPVDPAADFDQSLLTDFGAFPAGVAVDTGGRLYVTSYTDGTITVVDTDGTRSVLTVGGSPVGIAISPDGRVMYVDNGSQTLRVLDPETGDASVLAQVAGAPTGIAVDSEGWIYVTSGDMSNVQVFDATGTLLGELPLDHTPGSVAVAPSRDTIYVTSPTTGTIAVFRQSGDVDTLEIDGAPFGIAVGADGTLYVTDLQAGTLSRFDADGELIQTWPVGTQPAAVTLGSDGRIYVANAQDGTVAVLTPAPLEATTHPGPAIGTPVPGFPGDISAFTPRPAVVGPDGTVFHTVVTNDEDGNFRTTVIAFGQTMTEPIDGRPVGDLVTDAHGTAYQAIYDSASGTTTLVKVSSGGLYTATVVGWDQPVGSVVVDGDGTAYLVTWQGTSQQSADVTAIRSNGYVTTFSVAGSPGGAVLGHPAGPTVIDGVAYQTLMVTNSSGSFDTTVVALTPTGPAAVDGAITGVPVGGLVLGADGLGYQTIYDPFAGTPRTVVAALTPNGIVQVGDALAGVPTTGQTYHPVVVAADGTAYQNILDINYATGTVTPKVAVITPDGTTTVHALEASFGADTFVGPVVLDSNGTGYQSSYRPTTNGHATTITAITAAGVTSTSVPGYPGSPLSNTSTTPVVASDGTVYVAVAVPDSDNETYSTTVVTITPTGITTRSVQGEPIGIVTEGSRVYVSTFTTDADTTYTTHVTVLSQTGIHTVDAELSGAPTGAVTIGPDGDVYQTVVNAERTTGEVSTTVHYLGTLAGLNQAPQIDSDSEVFTTNTATGVSNGAVHAHDTDGDQVSYAPTATPIAGVGTVTVDPVTGTWKFVPTLQARHDAFAAPGDDFATFDITATDGLSTDTIAITVPITALSTDNHAPGTDGTPSDVTVDPASGVVSGQMTFDDPEGDTITYTVTSVPNATLGKFEFDSATGAWTFTPTTAALLAAQRSSTPLTATFQVTASDGDLTTAVPVSAPIGVSDQALAAILSRSGSQPSAVAVGLDGTIFVANSGSNTVSAINPATMATTTVHVGRAPSALAVNIDGRVWVTNTDDDTVTVLSPEGYVVRHISVGDAPSAIATDRYGRVFVANAGDDTVSVLGPASSTVGRTIAVGATPTGIAVGADERVYVANFDEDSITIIDPRNDYATNTIDGVGGHPYGIAVGDDGSIYVTNPLSDTVTVLTPPAIGGASLRTSALSAGDGYTRLSIAVGSAPSAITLGSDGTVYVVNTGAGTMTAINPRNNSTTTFSVGKNPNAIALRNGPVYVVNGGADSLSMLNLTTGQFTQTVPIGVNPSTVSVGHNGEFIVVSNYTGHVAVISPTQGVDPEIVLSATRLGYSPWAVGPHGETYRLVNTSFIFPEWSIRADSPAGQQISQQTVAFMYDSLPYQHVVAEDGRVYYLMTSYNPYASGGQYQTYLASVDPLNPDGLHYMYNTLDGRYGVRDDNLSNVMIGPDGRIYVQETNGLLEFDREDGDPWGAAIPFTYEHPERLRTEMGPNGVVYAYTASGSDPALEVINLATGESRIVALPNNASSVAFGQDGRIYLGAATGNTVTVLRSDLTVDATLNVGVAPSEISVVGDYLLVTVPNGLLAFDSSNDYAISTVRLPEGAQRIVGSDGAVYYAAPDKGAYSLIRVTGTAGSEDPGTPSSQSPETLTELWDTLRNDPTVAGNGVMVQTVRGDDGQTRLIVYLGGTTGDLWEGNQAIRENVPAVAGELKNDQLQAIDNAISDCAADVACGGVKEIMFVGYSQGGIDAQNLAQHYSSIRNTVITYGSPITKATAIGDEVLHIQDSGDWVPGLVTQPLVDPFGHFARTDLWANATNTVFEGSSGVTTTPDTSVLGQMAPVHTNPESYTRLSDAITYNSPGKYQNVKDAIDRFEGTVYTPVPVRF